MKYLSIFSLFLLLAACSKNETTCTARTANGEAMYEVVGKDLCEDQVSQANGEYCDCRD